jgi:hypothetical protein
MSSDQQNNDAGHIVYTNVADLSPGWRLSDSILDMMTGWLADIVSEQEAAAAPEPPPQWLSISAFAKAYGYDRSAVVRWVKLGMPHIGKGRNWRISVPEALAWIWKLQSGTLKPSLKSFVYFARDSDGRIKIGVTTDVERRLGELQRAIKGPVELLGVIDGDRGTEAALHALLASDRLEGEWFKPSDAVISAIPRKEEP